MADIETLKKAMPIAPLKLIVLEGCKNLGENVNRHLVSYRKKDNIEQDVGINLKGYQEDNFIVDASCPRFGSGEGKGIIHESIRGKDLYILVVVCNYSLTYKIGGRENHMSPDDHFQDLKRMISAANGKAKRINVIMPFLYESRQHKRTKRESLDCAFGLQELVDMGVSNIITFDAHDPRVSNAIPLKGFDNFMPSYQFIKALLKAEPNLHIDNEHLMVISPDEGAMNRAIYFSNVLGIDMGMFYKRRDYTTVVNGKNPIIEHEFLGADVSGKDMIIIDDMISSGESMLDTARMLKERGANRVFICTTFGLFSDGLAKFDKYYEKNYIDRVITTNLVYQTDELKNRPYYVEADMSKFLASIIDALNHEVSISLVLSPTEKIHKALENYNKKI